MNDLINVKVRIIVKSTSRVTVEYQAETHLADVKLFIHISYVVWNC